MCLIFLRHCRECGKPYDIGVEYDLCQECRGIKINEVEDGKKS